ncbi:MAG: endonuclease [Alloprevotella sp.]|nr:endonuclease [Alloprevotella sp.]
MKRIHTLLPLLMLAVTMQAQHTNLASYYAAAKGKAGQELKTALCGIIYSHTTRDYGQLWTDFRKTDVRSDGCVWDMYSGITNYTFGTDQAGNYSGEGDKYNREHSFPNSWFGGDEDSPMYTDLFHLYPTDGYVNGKRGNYAFGETGSPTYTSANGFSKLGPCSTPGCPSGTVVFEPNDLYKGDFARSYFYMVTCYEAQLEAWYTSYGTKEGIKVTLDGQKYPGLQAWQLTMLRRWSAADAVSAKETRRNHVVDSIQGNRNPFIDFPGLEEYIWGDKVSVAFDPENYGAEPPTPVTKPAAPVFSLASGRYATPRSISVTAEDGCTIYYHWGAIPAAPSARYTGAVSMLSPGTYYLRAYAQNTAGTKSDVAEAVYVYSTAAGGVFTKVTDVSQLKADLRYLIVYEDGGKAMGPVGTSASGINVTVEDGTIDISGLSTPPTVFTLGTSGSYYRFKIGETSNYLGAASSGTNLASASSSGNVNWTVTLSGGNAKISNAKRTTNQLLYRADTYNFFKNYASSNLSTPPNEYYPVALYVEQQGAAADYGNGYYQLRNAGGAFLRVGEDGGLGLTADGNDLGTVFTLRQDAETATYTLSAQGRSLAATATLGTVNMEGTPDALTLADDPDGCTVRFGSGFYLDAAAQASETADGWILGEAPSLTRRLNTPAGGTSSYATLYVPFAFVVETASTSVYTVRAAGTEAVTTALAEVVPPATPVVIENADAAQSIRLTPVAGGLDATAPAQDLRGTFLPVAAMDGAYVFSAPDGLPGFYRYSGATLGGNKAYLLLAGSEVRGFVLSDGSSTGIRSAESDVQPVHLHDLQGRRVARPRQGGVYIRDGRKVMVR